MTQGRNQNSRRWVNFCITVILISVLTVPLIFNRERSFVSALAQQVRRGEGTVIRLSELTHLPWDHVCIFGPYTPPAQIEQTIGIAWPGASDSGIEMSETFNLIVFVSDHQVALSVRYPRSYGDFDPSVCRRALTQQQSLFVVTRDESGSSILSQVRTEGAPQTLR